MHVPIFQTLCALPIDKMKMPIRLLNDGTLQKYAIPHGNHYFRKQENPTHRPLACTGATKNFSYLRSI